ncbi:MAG: hypothetical protein IJO75_05580 [Clostridia bacterium]|nr:hypothetical protein [Clostridia bacterium]
MKHGAKREKRIKWLTGSSVTVAGAFVLSLLAFGLIFLLPVLSARLTPDDIPEEVLGERGMERSVWLLFHDGDTLTGLVKLSADTRTMTVEAVGYPPGTELIDGVTVTTAAALYPTWGERVATELENLTVLTLPTDGAAALIGRVSGNLPITLPQAVGSLPKGELTLTPLQAAEVLTFEGWEQGGVGQAWAHAQLTAAFLQRTLTDTLDVDSAFGELTAVCETRLNISQLEAVRGELTALADCRISARVAAGYMTGVKEQQRYVLG